MEEEEKKKLEREAKILESLGSQVTPVCEVKVTVWLLRMRRGQPLYKGQRTQLVETPLHLKISDKGPSLSNNLSLVERLHCIRDKGPNLSLVERLHCIRDKGPIPNLSLVERLHCIRDKGPVPNLSLVERLHCIRDKGPNLSLVERLHCIRDKGPVPNLSLVERLHCIRDKGPIPSLSLVERLHCIEQRTCPQLVPCREAPLYRTKDLSLTCPL